MWIPRFACPVCRALLEPDGGDGSWSCAHCGMRISRRGNLFDALSSARRASADAFAAQYRTVRAGDGFAQHLPDYYRMLPCVVASDPHAAEWRIRRDSYATLQRAVLPDTWEEAVRVADLGAGSGWLSHKLAALGHAAVAVDRLDDDADGLGACRHYPEAFPAIRADFDALPFEPEQFNLVVFNASLHYATNPAETLAAADGLLVPGGVIVVMDSPMFRDDRDGQRMVTDELQRFERDRGITAPQRCGAGFLTYDGLAEVAARLGRSATFTPSPGALGWRARRAVARIRMNRAPAAFGVWVAR